jgi:hypothetical protein
LHFTTERDGAEQADDERRRAELERETDEDHAAVKRAEEARQPLHGGNHSLARLARFTAHDLAT